MLALEIPRHRRAARPALAAAAAAFVLAACGGGGDAPASGPTARALAASSGESSAFAALAVPGGSMPAALPRGLRGASGEVEVWVQLADVPVAVKKKQLRPDAPGVSWKASDAALKAQLKAYRQDLKGKQDALSGTLAGLGGRELARVQVAHNALAVKVGAARLQEIAALPGVAAVRPVRHYELMLGETVPYVGGSAAQAAGQDGTGVRVAVLDSGIDYTHRNLGGPGTAAAYAAAYGAAPGDAKQTTRDGLFPTAKVVDGYDFVGEGWPATDRTEDPDPIDFEGHGTHVADIIAGIGPNKGMAPGARLVAVKVCSAVSSSCNGIALLKGMDFALDPNGDGDVSDAVDVINLSLGSSYGQQEDDLSLATSNAVGLGVSVVASAGNSANRPYIVGSPSSAPGVLSVAQTQVPSALAYPLVVTGITPQTISNTALVDWAPIGAGFSGAVARLGRGCPAGSIDGVNPDDPYFNGNSPAGMVALIDRGACAVSLKVDRATKAGALAVIIANNASGDPPSFSFGGGDLPLAPTIIITQADGNRIKSALGAAGVNPAVVASVSPAVSVALVGSMVASSSRGPGFGDSALKPEIGAPGASVSAIAGSGGGEEAFGGTSGAAPMVAGAAAILRGAFPERSPEQIKAMLMNSAHNVVYSNPATQPGVLAPVSRIGAGELRVARALQLHAVAYDERRKSAAVSFGFQEVGDKADLKAQLTIENFSATARTYAVASAYRYADDAASGATKIEVPASVTVPAGGKTKIDVRMLVDGSKLPAWGLDGGPNGGNGARLEGNEVDGYLTLSSGSETLSVPFHALLRKSSNVAIKGGDKPKAGQDFELWNKGVSGGYFDVFALIGTSDEFKKKVQPQPGDNFALLDLRAVGVRQVGSFLQFAVSRWDRRAHPAYPAEIDILIDANGDGVDDYLVYTVEATGFAATGQVLVAVLNLSTGQSAAYFYVDADLQSGNMILTIPTATPILSIDPTKKLGISVFATDNYFTGTATDAIEGMSFTPATPRYAAGVAEAALGAGSSLKIGTAAVAGGAAASPSQSGFLLLYRQNEKTEAEIVTVRP